MEFKVGDRVRVYEISDWKGRVVMIGQQGELYIKPDGFNRPADSVPYHPKQCRKLVKKSRRRIWIPRIWSSHDLRMVQTTRAGWLFDQPSRMSKSDWIEFAEIRPKKQKPE